jgi:hypothetical protein
MEAGFLQKITSVSGAQARVGGSSVRLQRADGFCEQAPLADLRAAGGF